MSRGESRSNLGLWAQDPQGTFSRHSVRHVLRPEGGKHDALGSSEVTERHEHDTGNGLVSGSQVASPQGLRYYL